MNKKVLMKDAAAAFLAQGITAAVSAVTVLVLAGKMGAAEYGLWQFFVLVSSFSGLLHFGLCDGVYLRLGGSDYDSLDFYSLSRQFRSMVFSGLFIAAAAVSSIILLSGVGLAPSPDVLLVDKLFYVDERGEWLWALSSAFLYMPLFNAVAFLGFILQATGRTSAYSMSCIIDRLVFVAVSVLGIVFGLCDFRFFIAVAYISKTASLLYCVVLNRKIVFYRSFAQKSISCKANPIPDIRRQTRSDIAAGSRLMLANMAALLTTGGARFAIVSRWGKEEFGHISFVMTLASLALQFAAQFSMVLFPSIRRENEDAQERIFSKMDLAAGMLLPAIFLLYLPGKLAVSLILPQYVSRLRYLAYLFPLCFFEARTQTVAQVRLKVWHMENKLLAVNLLCGIVTTATCFIAANFFEDIGAVLICSSAGAALRCLLAELSGGAQKPSGEIASGLLCGAAASAVFFAAATNLSDTAATAVYAAFYVFYLLLRRIEIKNHVLMNTPEKLN